MPGQTACSETHVDEFQCQWLSIQPIHSPDRCLVLEFSWEACMVQMHAPSEYGALKTTWIGRITLQCTVWCVRPVSEASRGVKSPDFLYWTTSCSTTRPPTASPGLKSDEEVHIMLIWRRAKVSAAIGFEFPRNLRSERKNFKLSVPQSDPATQTRS